jgi:hypothetical protein
LSKQRSAVIMLVLCRRLRTNEWMHSCADTGIKRYVCSIRWMFARWIRANAG